MQVSDSLPFPIWFVGKSSDGMLLTKGHTIPQPILLTFRRKTRTFYFSILSGHEDGMLQNSFSRAVRCFKVYIKIMIFLKTRVLFWKPNSVEIVTLRTGRPF